MKILYIANIRLPTEKAHGVQIMEMASALSREGSEVELVVPRRKNHLMQDPFEFYQIQKTFTITRLFTWDLLFLGKVGYKLTSLLFTIASVLYALKQKQLVYSRDELALFLLSVFGKQYVFEPHIAKWNFIEQTVMERALLIIPITQGLKDFFIQKGVPPGRMLVAHDGVNLERFTHNLSQKESRIRVGLPLDKKIVLYSGHLYFRKGAQTLAEAASSFEEDTLIAFVGGNQDDIVRFTEKYGGIKNIRIMGHQPHEEVPYYLSAADVLVLPNSMKSDDSRLYTSPMKLFEYMSSGVPIVASDVPSLREVLSENTAQFVLPDDAQALTEGILHVLSDKGFSSRIAIEAKNKCQSYSWNNRARTILEEITSLT